MLATLKESGKDLLSFLKNPTDQSAPDQDLTQKVKQLFSLLAIGMGLVLLVDFPLMYLIELTGLIDMDGHALTKAFEHMPVWLLLLTSCIAAPVLEEIIFRTFLTYKRNYPLKLLIAIAGLGGKRSKVRIRALLKRKWRSYYSITFFSIALLFAYIHINNYEGSVNLWLLSPFLILPQFLAGLIFGYIRVRQGLLWSIFLHNLHNFILIGSAILFMGITTEKLDFITEAYKIKIEEAAIRGTKNSSSSMGQSTVSFENIRLLEILMYLLDKDEKLLKIEEKDKANLLLNISFTQWSDTINRKMVILNHLQEVYKFTIDKENSLTPVSDLQLSDSVKLAGHQVNLSESVKAIIANFNSQEKKLNLKNANAETLTLHLNKSFNLYYIAEQGLPGIYNFELTLSSPEELEKELMEKYGISVVAKEKMAEQITVNF